MLSRMDKKTRTLLIALIVIPIIFILFLIILRGCNNSSSYSSYENKMVKGAEKYFNDKNSLPITEGGEVIVTLDDLVKEGYIKPSEKLLKNSTCVGSVTVRNNGASVKKNNGGLYLYTPYLSCSDYTTTYIIDKLKEDIVTEKSGLYETSDGYVYKGNKVNNFVSFFGKNYLIISIDNNNILKLVKAESEKEKVIWDDKFNSEVDMAYGKNDYSDSYIIEKLTDDYLATDENKRKHLIAYDVCYGNRPSDYDAVDKVYECSKKLENQFISLLNPYDYAMASYDQECTSIYSGSCSNYNYLYDNVEYTWLMNGLTDNTYEVYSYQGYISYDRADIMDYYNIVIYVSGNEVYTKGDGSLKDPYVIK